MTSVDRLPNFDSDESELDPDFVLCQNPESADIHDTPTYESSSEDIQTDLPTTTIQVESFAPLTRHTRTRQPVQRYKTYQTPRPPRHKQVLKGVTL